MTVVSTGLRTITAAANSTVPEMAIVKAMEILAISAVTKNNTIGTLIDSNKIIITSIFHLKT